MTKLKILVVLLFAAGSAALLFTNNFANPHARAYSAGPPAGFTHAPGELDCADCHTVPAESTGTLTLNAPQSYTPGQTYDISVAHSTADPTRVRWGFEMTALDASDERAGSFAPADDLTRVISGEGPFPGREYVEHTSNGTFPGQQDGASWTFRWTAPTEDVGPVTFYVAGNQADGDGSSAGDNIYFTFASANFAPPAPDFLLTVAPSSRTAVRGAATTYDVTVTPLGGFTGTVNLGVTGLPSGATAAFEPASVNLSGGTPQAAVLTVTTSGSTPAGASTLDVSATSGAATRNAQATLNVVLASDADLALTQTVSPNPAQTDTDIRFTITVTNNGPATASAIDLFVTLPFAFHTFTEGTLGERCGLSPATNGNIYACRLADIPAGQSTTLDFTVRTSTQGVLQTTTTVRGIQNDPFPANNRIVLALPVARQAAGPSMTVPGLGVRTVVAGLDQPTSLAFLGPNDFLILEKATGRVVRIRNGVSLGAVLDLPVNSASERGLLGVALHPNFGTNGFAYLYWTESSTGADTTAVDEVPLLGNRVDRFVWNGSSLAYDRTLKRLRALQQDAGQPSRGNHNAGVLRFGPDGKLYVLVGDVGRRGAMQNLPCGPIPACGDPIMADDQYGGPGPDDPHYTGVILRLNDDGTTPPDNPFASYVSAQPSPELDNIRRTFAYGIRNGFGMDFDPVGGHLWTQENGDDAFDEINRVEAGFNGGWIQLMGPSSRVAEYKAIEVARGNSLQQNRWPPTYLADTPEEALARIFQFKLVGSEYTEPEFSWKYAVAPSPVGFAGAGLGLQYGGDLFVGASRTTLLGGYLMRFRLSADRKHLVVNDSRLADKVADNDDKFDLSESESLVVGRDFGVTTDIRNDPFGGNLYVVSLSNGAVYEVYARPTLFVANLDGNQEVPSRATNARGTATLLLDKNETTARVSLRFRDLSGAQTAAEIHAPAPAGQNAPPVFTLPNGNFNDFEIALTPQQAAYLKAGLFYVNVHSTAFPTGEIRGQFGAADEASVFQFDVAEQEIPESAQVKTVNVIRLGDTSTAASVDYATADGIATERSDYTTARGTLNFAPGETQKSFDILITDDGISEPAEGFTVGLSNPTGPVALNSPGGTVVLAILDNDQAPPATNPIDDSAFFVRQHYHDFLNREPDASGLAHWTGEIESCGANAACREVKRVNVSAAFFLSIEFQETGFLVYRLYTESFARRPRFAEFMADTQEIGRGIIVGQPGWEAQLAARRQAFANAWVTRPAFRADFGHLSNRNFVDLLLFRAGVNLTPAERDALIAALDAGARTRARVLLEVAENAAFKSQEFNRAFVLMEYFGYLRRNPDDPPDSDLSGYNFWLAKLSEFNGDYIRAEMVKAFISSAEYRGRFGRP
ncbi:MAG: PQQ-dependent sugar dehydrogenase [Acidobacteria bacterium]|nr:PQQ-dependent sugar dehydrogenase [Acidobacteriota bacterium]